MPIEIPSDNGRHKKICVSAYMPVAERLKASKLNFCAVDGSKCKRTSHCMGRSNGIANGKFTNIKSM